MLIPVTRMGTRMNLNTITLAMTQTPNRIKVHLGLRPTMNRHHPAWVSGGGFGISVLSSAFTSTIGHALM